MVTLIYLIFCLGSLVSFLHLRKGKSNSHPAVCLNPTHLPQESPHLQGYAYTFPSPLLPTDLTTLLPTFLYLPNVPSSLEFELPCPPLIK